jgi:isopenicillin N synthase-like dioxygenase
MAQVAKIPVIDISGDDQTQVAKDLVEAAIEHGFVYIKNTGKDLPVEAIDGAFEMVPGPYLRCWVLDEIVDT